MVWWLSVALSQAPVTQEAQRVAPIEVVKHPRYEDAAGAEVPWSEVRQLARTTGAIGRVRRRRVGRTVLRIALASVTALEVWGTLELARRDSYLAAPLGAQAGVTGLAAILMWTRMPSDLQSDRAELLEAANARLSTTMASIEVPVLPAPGVSSR